VKGGPDRPRDVYLTRPREEVARRIGEPQGLIEVISANSDSIDYGEMIRFEDGTGGGNREGLPDDIERIIADVESC